MRVCADTRGGCLCARVCTHLCMYVQKPEDTCVREHAHIYVCVCRSLKRRPVCESTHNFAHVCRSQKTTATVLFYDSILLPQGPSLNLAFFLFSLLLSHQACWLVNFVTILSLCLPHHPFALESLTHVTPDAFVLLLGSVLRLPCWHSTHLPIKFSLHHHTYLWCFCEIL